MKKLLTAACILAGAGALRAQSPAGVTLQPLDTGRSVATFDLGGGHPAPARYQIKTNLLWAGATLTPNLAFEFGTGRRTSIELLAGVNKWGNLWDNGAEGEPFDINNLYKRKLDHVYGKAEFRYWPRERFRGHFFGVGAFFADYRAGELDLPLIFEKEYDYDGIALGGSLSYGYLWRLSRVMAAEFSVSFGAARFDYDRGLPIYSSEGWILQDVDRYRKIYFGPTGAGIKLVFTIR
jgi:hypothetical protein